MFGLLCLQLVLLLLFFVVCFDGCPVVCVLMLLFVSCLLFVFVYGMLCLLSLLRSSSPFVNSLLGLVFVVWLFVFCCVLSVLLHACCCFCFLSIAC